MGLQSFPGMAVLLDRLIDLPIPDEGLVDLAHRLNLLIERNQALALLDEPRQFCTGLGEAEPLIEAKATTAASLPPGDDEAPLELSEAVFWLSWASHLATS